MKLSSLFIDELAAWLSCWKQKLSSRKKRRTTTKRKTRGAAGQGMCLPLFNQFLTAIFVCRKAWPTSAFSSSFSSSLPPLFYPAIVTCGLYSFPQRKRKKKKYFPRAVLLALSIGRHAPGLSFCVRVCVLLSIDVEATTREKHTRKYLSLSLSLVLCLSAGPLIQSGRGRWLLLISVKAMATQHTAQRIPLQSPFFCDD